MGDVHVRASTQRTIPRTKRRSRESGTSANAASKAFCAAPASPCACRRPGSGQAGTGDEEALHEAVPLLTYTATRTGLWYVTHAGPKEWSLRVLRNREKTPMTVYKYDFPPGNNLSLSLSPDERFALTTKGDDRGTDLLLVDKYR